LLDELTTEPDGAKESIESLFRHFYDHGKQIIATVPMTFDQFTAHYNGCITRRMDDMGVFVELSGDRYRDKRGRVKVKYNIILQIHRGISAVLAIDTRGIITIV